MNALSRRRTGTAMNHVAVDLGSRQSQLCVRSAEGQIQQEGKVANAELRAALAALPRSRVILESSSEAFAVADLALEAGHEVNIVPSGLARNLGVGQRGVKTDKKDAQNLSMASCRMEMLPQVHLPSMQARELRRLLTSRAQLVTVRTGTVNCVRGWLRSQLLRAPRGTCPDNFAKRIRELALSRPEGLPEHIERLLKVVETLNEQLKAADKELEKLTEDHPICQRLMTMPGVGPVTSATFWATLDDVKRFKTAHAVESYVGLTPGESSSGQTVQKLGITRAGSTRARAVLVQAAWSAWRTRPNDPMVQWARGIAERRPIQVAVTALARKMVGILFALWRDEAKYEPMHGRNQQK
jgi:transposase